MESVYPIVFFDAIVMKVRENSRIQKKSILSGPGYYPGGSKRELSGLWPGENEGGKFWLSIITELRNRGYRIF